VSSTDERPVSKLPVTGMTQIRMAEILPSLAFAPLGGQGGSGYLLVVPRTSAAKE
jgi:hypothetical protein